MRPAIQLYTLRALDEPLPDLLERVGATAFEGVEFAGLGDSDPADVADALDDAGLDAAAAHVGVEALEADSDAVVETYRELGCDTIVVPYLPDTAFEDAAAVADGGRRLTEVADRLEQRGATFAYHNHDHEFAAIGESSGFDLLVGETDVRLELDAGWAAAAGRDPVELLDSLRDRVPLVHIKDVAGGEPVELGDGILDAEACVEAAREAGTEWAVYEHDEPADPAASLEHGAEALANLLE